MNLRLSVCGQVYEVNVEVADNVPERANSGQYKNGAAVPATAIPAPFANGNGYFGAPRVDRLCRSPLGGVVVKSNVRLGQRIEPGDPLVLVETMDLETNVLAEAAGIVKTIRVGPGDRVKVHQVLAELE